VGDVPTEPPQGAPATTPPPKPSAPRPPSGAPQGLLIQNVPPGSVLERIGLQPGDVVQSVNGEAVASEADVARVLQSRGAQGAPITAEVQRGGMTVPLALTGLR
jgi:S1-C subfamily serine protease